VIFGSRQLDVVVVTPIADHLEERQQRNEFASVRAKDFGEEIAGHRVGIGVGLDEGLRRHVDGQLVESRRHGEADAAAVGRAGPFLAPPLEEARTFLRLLSGAPDADAGGRRGEANPARDEEIAAGGPSGGAGEALLAELVRQVGPARRNVAKVPMPPLKE
jgi:hypothetical protein